MEGIFKMIIPEEVIRLVEPFDFKTMYELGNKNTYGTPYREYYKQKNIEYDCIDINGKDGALKLDLTLPLSLSSRDMITNIGVAEHILLQPILFKNIHDLSHDRMVHWAPLTASINGHHGLWRYERRFFTLLASINNYKINKSFILERENMLTILCIDFTKQNNEPFKWDEHFNKMIHRTRRKI
jgi:hypothetical protein